MKILMFGRGVITTVYGWALENAGHTIDFYVRPGRAAIYGPTLELELLDARRKLLGDKVRQSWPVRLQEDLPADHDYDIIFVSVQHYSLAGVAAFLSARLSKATVLVFNNLFAEPQAAVAPLPAGQVVWGFPQAGGGFNAKGQLVAALLPSVWLGTFGENPSARHLAVAEVFRGAGFKVSQERDFKGWLWVHFATNTGLHAQVLKLGSFSRVVGSVHELQQAVLNIREMLKLVEARGVNLRNHTAASLFRLPTLLVALLLKLVWRLPPLRVVVQAHSNVEELKLTCRDALDEAHSIGFPVPRLKSLEPGFSSGHRTAFLARLR